MLPRCEEVNVDKCKTSLKNALSTQSSQEDEAKTPVKNVFMIQNGMDGLKNNPKDLVKKVFEQCNTYYTNKKRDTKQKQRKLINKEQSENVRYCFKVGIYSQLSKGDL